MPDYNYSPHFLKAHEKLVQQLVDMAKNGRVGEVRVEEHRDAIAYRTLVLNLKRSLALNFPDMAFVHNILRTRIGRDDTGWWLVRVGPEDQLGDKRGHRLRGAKYTLIEHTSTPAVTVITVAEISTLIQIPFLIRQMMKEQKDAIVTKPPPEAGIEYLRTFWDTEANAGFEIVATEPHLHLRLRRENTSANDALPHE